MEKNSKLSFLQIHSYGIGEITLAGARYAITTYFMFYLTDVMLIAPLVVSTMFLIMKTFDAANDIYCGYLVDNTRTKWGSYRPWILLSIIPYLLSIGFSFSGNPAWSMGAKIAFMYVGYLLYTSTCTTLGVPYNAMSAALTTNTQDRARLMGSDSFWQAVASIGCVLIVSKLIKHFSVATGSAASGYTRAVWLLMLITIPFMFITCFVSRERVKPSKVKLSRGEMLSTFKCKNLIIAEIAALGFGFLSAGRGMGYSYYFAVVARDMTMLSIFNMIFMIGCALGGVIFPSVLKLLKGNKKNCTLLMAMVFAVFSIGTYWVTPDVSKLGFYILAAITGVATGAFSAVSYTLIIDCIEECYLRTGVRASSLVFGVASFLKKVGSAIAPTMIAIIQASTHYVNGAATQNPAAINGCNIILTVMPGVVMIVAVIPVLFYDLTPAKYAKIAESIREMEVKDDAVLATTAE